MSSQGHEIPDWLDVSRETFDLLVELEALVLKWTGTVNLISRSSVPEIWRRHIMDSAQIAALGARGDLWADLGSGGGFPGLVLAVMAKQISPRRQFRLVDSDHRKAAFLAQAVKSLGLNATVEAKRIEALQPIGANVVVSRALGSLNLLLGYAERHILPQNGTALFLRGSSFREEVSAAQEEWSFDYVCHASRTEPQAAILEVSNFARR